MSSSTSLQPGDNDPCHISVAGRQIPLARSSPLVQQAELVNLRKLSSSKMLKNRDAKCHSDAERGVRLSRLQALNCCSSPLLGLLPISRCFCWQPWYCRPSNRRHIPLISTQQGFEFPLLPKLSSRMRSSICTAVCGTPDLFRNRNNRRTNRTLSRHAQAHMDVTAWRALPYFSLSSPTLFR